jgi:SAM-dependent methyltransferase
MANLPGAGTVLDLGCGYGRYALACEDRGLHYHGVDASEAMIRMVSVQRGSFECADLCGYRAAAPADAVLCTRVLSNLPVPFRAIQSVSRNLVPGGTFVITDFSEQHRYKRQTIKDALGGDVRIPIFRHAAATIRRAIMDGGLTLEEERVIHEHAGRPVLVMYRGTKRA